MVQANEIPEAAFFLKSERLLLRPPKTTDLDALWPHLSNPAISTFLAWEPHETLETSRSVLSSLLAQQESGTSYHWIVLKGNRLIGLVSLIDIVRNLRAWKVDRAELAYWISPNVQSQGLATEAAKLVVEFTFKVFGLHKILVYHAKDNPASRRVAEKLGCRHVGSLKDGFMKDGVWHDFGLYELLNPAQQNLTA